MSEHLHCRICIATKDTMSANWVWGDGTNTVIRTCLYDKNYVPMEQ